MRLCAPLLVIILGVGCAAPGQALDLSLPGSAVLTREVRQDATAYFVPTAPVSDGTVPAIEAEGAFVQQAWRLEAPGLTSLQMLRPLRDQISAAGYDILLDCAGQECGGFDFRFQTNVLPAPDMFVDLFDFRFLSAQTQVGDTTDFVTVLVSQVSSTGYIQVIRLAQSAQTTEDIAIKVTPDTRPADPAIVTEGPVSSLGDALLNQGFVVLADLDFGTGSVSLGPGPFASLDDLAAFLKEDPERRVALVGHTDSVGGLEPNVSLSRRRAASVADRLVEQYGIPRRQLEVNGMGYLSPVASNRTQDGREANRRVEAVLLNTE